ncbi:MAG: PilZ domain-containing protein [Fimbriimonas ginsengisoli]|uniref:PilZ domain-containing protein n=1 Tax=Fimbriimonas ginsengisoli TaxID=1005039 RepID=A0A931LZ90_FIMGI|nr:PilZ domain-containing protein [Fimbriimonas ginsengisoli]
MDNLTELRERLHVGNLVRLVFYTAHGAIGVSGRVCQRQPLSVTVPGASTDLVAEGTRAMMLVFDKVQYVRVEAAVTGVEHEGMEAIVRLSDEFWESADRRRYTRLPVSAPVQLRMIQDQTGAVEARTFSGKLEDLSIAGAWVRLDEPISPGSLVEFQASFGPTETVRVLGLVARVDEDGVCFGIEFVDYVGNARFVLHNFLSDLAA